MTSASTTLPIRLIMNLHPTCFRELYTSGADPTRSQFLCGIPGRLRPPAARACGRRRPDLLAGADALHHAGDLWRARRLRAEARSRDQPQRLRARGVAARSNLA